MATQAQESEVQPPAKTAEQPQSIEVHKPKPPMRFGVPLATLDDAWRMATAIAKSELAPKDFKSKPENCLIAMQMGAEIGLPPMAAIQNIAIINGRPSLYGDGFLAVIVSHPEYEDHTETIEGSGDERVAICRFKRKGKEWKEGRFSVADAKAAGLWKKAGPWTQYTERMMQFRARGFAGRDSFPDALRGISLAEEVRDYTIHTIDAQPEQPEDPNADIKNRIADLLINKVRFDEHNKRWNQARVTTHINSMPAELLPEYLETIKTQKAPEPKPVCPKCAERKAKCFDCLKAESAQAEPKPEEPQPATVGETISPTLDFSK